MNPGPIRKAMHLEAPINDLRPNSAGEVRAVLTSDGPRVELVAPRLPGQQVAVDYCSITLSEDIVRRMNPAATPFSDREHCQVAADYVVDHILQLSPRPTYKLLDRGIFGYSVAFQLGNYGLVAAGGNGWTVYISLTGHAFACADVDLCNRLYRFVNDSPSSRLTRIDLCHDDFKGQTFTPDAMLNAYREGHFTAQAGSKKPPRLEQRGDWERGDIDQRGRTLYIGARTAGRLMRFYEKGKQLGDTSSPWCRAEIELRNNVFHLVPEMLINPTGFFVACSPVFALVGMQAEPEKLERIAREGIATVERVLDIIKTQYGVHIDVLRREFFSTDAELLDAITRKGVTPPALKKADELHQAAVTVAAAPTH